MPNSSTHKFLVAITTDGRYDHRPKDLEDLVGGRMWSMQGVEPNGVEVTLLNPEIETEVKTKAKVIELNIVGAEPEMVVLPKSAYQALLKIRDQFQNSRPRGPRSDNG